MTKSTTILQARRLTKSYRLDGLCQEVLRQVDLEVKAGEFLAIMGASGSGKSTLLHILGLLDKADSGSVAFEGADISSLPRRRQDAIRGREIGFVFQFYHLLPELNVQENILLPLMVNTSVLGWCWRRRQARRQAGELLEAMGLAGKERQKPLTLSGGERQRVALARALICKPKLLLADEPTGNLDSQSGKAILDIIVGLNRSGQTVVMVTHDPAVAALAHRKLTLTDGKLLS